MEVLKIGLLGVAGVMVALQFKSHKPEFGLYIGFAVCLLIFLLQYPAFLRFLKE